MKVTECQKMRRPFDRGTMLESQKQEAMFLAWGSTILHIGMLSF